MNILLVYPEYPKTYWSFHYALQFVSKKACFPPLGLLTVAAMLPESWSKKLVDLNTSPLKDHELLWADYVFISAMVIQKASARKIIDRCKGLGVKVVAGGPLFTCSAEEFNDVDHLVLNEGELTLPQFLHDLEVATPKHIYTAEGWPDLDKTPVPLWDLVNIKNYSSLNLQYSRGCPFHCEFCNITSLFGHTPRTKGTPQLLKELEAIYATGWRGGVFFVDDNFIGNRQKLKTEVLPSLIQWMADRKYPFSFITEASINLADDGELMELMVKAGFDTVFIGIETPNEDSLAECNKLQNKNRNLMISVKKIQQSGLQVQGGFILGFDHDNGAIFNKLVNFIQESGIVTAMVGLLNAPKGTGLYQRLAGEGRLLKDFSGDNTDLTMNFIPRMNIDTLIRGYKRTVDTIYAPKQYYARVMTFLKEYNPLRLRAPRISATDVKALFRSIVRLGLAGQERLYFWKLFFWSLFKRPSLFPLAITLSIYGFHFRKIYESNSPDPG
ncbi:MAG TPA: DUF4070 domain-containing protein [Bacillota bacterium]|nr:DUF4070 domain-containing protein [Bacillota bacterium]